MPTPPDTDTCTLLPVVTGVAGRMLREGRVPIASGVQGTASVRSGRAPAGIAGSLFVLLVVACGTAIDFAPPTAFGPGLHAPSPSEIADAVRFRSTFGLRSDESWIRQVADDPASWRGLADFGVPLTLEEYAELEARQANADALAGTLRAYGESVPDEWAGAFIDYERGGVIVALFTGHLDQHRAAISRIVNPKAKFDVRIARWSILQLDEFRLQIGAQADWLMSVGAHIDALDIDPWTNAVLLRVTIPAPILAQQIVDHLGSPQWLEFESHVGPPSGGLVGSLHIQVLTFARSPASDVDCVILPFTESLEAQRINADRNGECRIADLPVGSYAVEIQGRQDDSDDWVVVARERVVIMTGTEADLVIVVTAPRPAVGVSDPPPGRG